jgi:lysozyme
MKFSIGQIWASIIGSLIKPMQEVVTEEPKVEEKKPVVEKHRSINDAGLHIIKHYESFRSKPYICPAGVPTIGYGCTYYETGKRVTLNDPPITEAQASELLKVIVIGFESSVSRYVKVELTDNEFSALVCLVYNIGTLNFAGNMSLNPPRKPSTVLTRLNLGDKAGAAQAFGMWIKGSGKVLPGLVKRRESEKQLFLTV